MYLLFRFLLKYIYENWITKSVTLLSRGNLISGSDRKWLISRHRYLWNRKEKLDKLGSVLILPQPPQEYITRIDSHNDKINKIINKCRNFNQEFEVNMANKELQNMQELMTNNTELFNDIITYKPEYNDEIKKFIDRYELFKGRNFSSLDTVINNIKRFNSWVKKERTTYIDENISKQKINFQKTAIYISKNRNALISVIEDKEVNEFLDIYNHFDKFVKDTNMKFVQSELKKHKKFFHNINGKALDQQQRIAIVTDEVNNLIIAGAGSGKTLTVVGKVKYLIEKKGISPKDILLISFTNKAVDEIKERICMNGKGVPDVMTFHKLGLSIIKKANEKKPSISDQEQLFIIKSLFEERFFKVPENAEKFIEFIALYFYIPVDKNDYKDANAYIQDIKDKDLETIRSKCENYRDEEYQKKKTFAGERVKSIEELIIANFLYVHGIKYEYEKPYEYDTSSFDYRQYHPDFYLPDYDIYLEHFGVDENGRAKWLDEFEENKYIEGMKWKRELHKKYHTKLIETYSYYSKQGKLVSNLKKMLEKNGVSIKPVDRKRLIEMLLAQKRNNQLEGFIRLISSFLQLYKSNNYNEQQFDIIRKGIEKKKEQEFSYKRESLIIDMIQFIYNEYERYLHYRGEIDFNDMINQATEAINSNRVKIGYKYIIIDEYQDIAVNRYQLIKSIKSKTNAKVIGVGDDWQSIYRFTGSDVSLFKNFSNYFGKTEVMKIEKTYRNSKELINYAGRFIQKNPQQIKKGLISDKSIEDPIKVIEYQWEIQVIVFIDLINTIHENNMGDILVLGRNNFNINPLLDSGQFQLLNDDTLVYTGNKNIKMKYLTVHRSKGLEGDNVIVLGVNNQRIGFPNKIADDPILQYVLNDDITFDYEEERRLFYVALTRTRNRTYLMTEEMKYSQFIIELIEDYNIPVQSVVNGEESSVLKRECPICKSKTLVIRSGPYGKFVSCSNFPYCTFTINNIKAVKQQKRCPVCGNYLILKNGQYGKFYGCHNYPYCNHTENYYSGY